MSAPSKGKQATKGQKQIYEENVQTKSFYFYMMSITSVIHFAVIYFLFKDSTPVKSWVLFGISVSVQLASYQFMKYMATPIVSDDGKRAVVDAGIDLNMEGGLGEYCKDVIILSSGVQILTIISVYFWWLYVLGPVYLTYFIWTNFLAPWFFAPAPETDPEAEDKKRRKKEKRMIVRR